MKGRISAVKRMEIHDGDGLRTTVFFKGCPLSCVWCHNPEGILREKQVAFFEKKCVACGNCNGKKGEEEVALCPTGALTLYGEDVESEELVARLIKDKVFFQRSGGGVTLSGGECLFQAEFCLEVAKRLKENGVNVYIDTCGFVSREILERILPYTDCFLYDLKAVDPEVHRRCTGQDNSLILQNLDFLLEKGARVEIRYPLVVGFNDAECEAIGNRLSGKKIDKIKVLRYHNFSASRYESLGMKNTLPPPDTTDAHVKMAIELLTGLGLNAVSAEE